MTVTVKPLVRSLAASIGTPPIPPPPPPPPENELLVGLASYWKCDETSATAPLFDTHGSADMGVSTSAAPVPGIIAGARELVSANGQFFLRQDTGSLDLAVGNTDFTLQAWVYLYGLTGINESILARYFNATSNFEYALFYDASLDIFSFQRYWNNAPGNPLPQVSIINATNFGMPPLNTWLLVHAWSSAMPGGEIGISVNAGPANTMPLGGTPILNTNSMTTMGSLFGSAVTWFFDGRFDEFGFWRRILMPSERSLLWNGGAGLPYSQFGP